MGAEPPRLPRRLALAVACAAALFAPPRAARAQEAPPRADNQLFTLADAVASARRNVPQVLAAVGQARAAEGQIALARTAMQPFVTGTVTGQAYGSNSNQIVGAASSMGGTPCMASATGAPCTPNGGPFGYVFLDATLAVRWTLWDFGRTALNVEAAERSARSLGANVHATERTAIAAAATAYFAVLADEELVASDAEIVRQRERELEIARGRVNAGTDPEINRTRAEIGLSTAQLDLATARATVANDTAAMAAALGLDPAHPPRIVRPTEVAIDDDPTRAADQAASTRPEVIAARLRVASAESQVAATRALWRPSLIATGSAGARYTQLVTGSGTLLESAAASLALSFPIFDPTIPANVRIAEGNLITARADLAQQVLGVRTDAVQAALAVRAAREQLETAQRSAALAAANLSLAEGRYAAGVTTLLELVDAQAQDATARLAVVQRRFQFESAKVRLFAAVNRLGDLGAR